MSWPRLLLWTGLGLLTVIVATISWLFLADLGRFKPQIERWASETTGREVRIGGELHIDLAAHSSVIAEDLSISNAGWADEPYLLSVGRMEVRLDLGSLLRGPIVIELFDLDDATVSLAEPESGAPNWALLPQDSAPTDQAEAGPPRRFHFRRVDIDNLAVSYVTPADTEPMLLNVANATQQYRDDDFLDISLNGSLNNREITLAGELGTWNGLLQGKNVRFDLDARVDTFVLLAAGDIDDVLQPYRPRINFDATAPDVNDLLEVLGVEHLGEGDIDISGSLKPIEQGPLQLEMDGRVGRLDVDASGEFSDLRNLEQMDLDVLLAGADIRPILDAIGMPQARPSPFMVSVDATRSGSTLIINEADMVLGQARLDLSGSLPRFPTFDDGQVNLQIEGPDIEYFREMFDIPGAATGPFSVGATLDDAEDGFELLEVDLKTSVVEIAASGRIGDAPQYHGTTVEFRLQGDSLASVGSAYAIAGLPDRPIEIRGGAEFSAEGIRTVTPWVATVHDVAIQVEGLVKPVAGVVGSDFAFVLQGPDLAELIGEFADSAAVPVQPYNLEGRLQVRDDGYRFRGISGKLGSSDLQLDGLLVPRSGIVGSRFDFQARGTAIEELLEQLGDIGVRPGPYELAGKLSFRQEQIVFEEVELNRAAGNLDLGLELGLPLSRRSATFNLQASGPNLQSLLARVEGFAANEIPFLIDLQGSVADSAWRIDTLDFQAGLAKLQASGDLDFAGDASTTGFSMAANIPDVSALGTIDGRQPRAQSLVLEGDVTGGNGELRAENFLARIGESDIRGDVRFVPGEVPSVDLQIISDAIVIAPLLEEQTGPSEELTTALDDGRLFPDIEIPFDAMAGVDVSINAEIGQFQRDNLSLRDLVVRAEMVDGRLDLTDIRFGAPSGTLAARGYIDPQNGTGAASLEVVAREFALRMTDFNQDLSMVGDIDIKLESTGTNFRSLLGNATGMVFIDTRGGHMEENQTLQALYGNALQEIIGVINPFSKTEKRTEFECVILPLEINSGILTSNPNSLISTNKLQIATNSEVDLKTEKLVFNIKTAPKQGISISAGEIVNPYIKVVGTLAKPRLAVDEAGVLLSGGAAVATGGISILARAAWTRLSRSKDPCAETAAAGLEALADRFPTLTPPPDSP